MQRLAIVGSGIAGLGAAYLLAPYFKCTIFEKNDRLGGHTHTVEVPESGKLLPIDTGFMVFNKETYPNLIRLFEKLGVVYKPTEMSFSVQHQPTQLEWRGADWNGIFGQRKNLFNLRFLRMLSQLSRFNQQGAEPLSRGDLDGMSLQDYVRREKYGEDFLNFYLIPMTAAIWSSTPEQVMAFPASALLRFFHNHGFLGRTTQHQWYTVEKGAQRYIEKIISSLNGVIKTGQRLERLERLDDRVILHFGNGGSESFDKVILACHADEALQALAEPTELESSLLSAFRYQSNPVMLHTDTRVMPKSKHCWASWNYRIEPTGNGEFGTSTHYWMNNLQGVSQDVPYFVSLNANHLVNPEKVLRQFTFEHPIFNIGAIQAQESLPQINQQSPEQRVYFCGSYFRYGFHEDAFLSAIQLARQLVGMQVWPE